MNASNKCGAMTAGPRIGIGVGAAGDHAAREATRFERLGGQVGDRLIALQGLAQRLEGACDRIAGGLPRKEGESGAVASSPVSHLHRLEAQLAFLGDLTVRIAGCVDRLEEL